MSPTETTYFSDVLDVEVTNSYEYECKPQMAPVDFSSDAHEIDVNIFFKCFKE